MVLVYKMKLISFRRCFLVTVVDSMQDFFNGGYHGDFFVLVSCSGQVIRDKSKRELVIKKKPT
jgi:hypothetical protein